MEKFRKHIRLKGFDYSSNHYYFVTICTRDWQKVFAPFVDPKYGHAIPSDVAAGLVPAEDDVKGGAAIKAAATDIIKQGLEDIPRRFNDKISVDFYVIMSDHIHLIIAINDGDHKGRSYTLGNIVGAFKSLSTHAIWKLGHKGRLWQPNYYEHIIRSESSLDRIRNYILQNPYVEYDEINWKLLDPNM